MAEGLLGGFMQAVSPTNLLYCFIGCLLGTLVGVLPGLGPASSVAILFPLTFYLPPAQTLIVMAGVFYGAMYGGSTTAIVMNVPGEVASVPTAVDGYEMAKQGRAGPALAIAAIGSFIAGTIAVILLTLIGPVLARIALTFGPLERLGLLVFSLTAVAGLSGKSIMKGAVSALAGMALALVGPDPQTGVVRLAFGRSWLLAGFDMIPILVGLFGVAEVLENLREGVVSVAPGKIGRLLPRGEDLRTGLVASVRGGIVGAVLGVIPGMVPGVTSFIAYDVEKRLSRRPERFGKGAIEGVAAPEAANNATAGTGFIPLLCLGIPTTPTLAVLLAAFLVYGIFPGPMLFTKHADLAWLVIASMYVGNVILLVLNLPLVGIWARISVIPYAILGPLILGLCFVGAYCVRNSMFDVWTCILFGAAGVMMRKVSWPPAPLVLGFILGPMLEEALRQSVALSGGALLSAIVSRPLALGFFVVAGASILSSVLRRSPVTGQEAGGV